MNDPGFLAAGAAGFLSFLSPCVLPLIPAYLSYMSGAAVSEISAGKARAKVFGRSLGFSAGFTLVFVVLGLVFSGSAMFVGRGLSRYLGVAGGILVVALGLNMIFDVLKFLNADARLIGRFSGGRLSGRAGPVLFGAAFAAGWSPCIGPMLASILLLAGRQGNLPRAAALLFAYSLGFAVPFLAAGLFFDRLKPAFAFFAKRGGAIRRVSGAVLVLLGAAMAAGSLSSIPATAAKAGYALQTYAAKHPAGAKALGTGIWIAAAAACLAPVFFGKKGIFTGRAATQGAVQSGQAGNGAARREIVLAICGLAAIAAAAAELAGPASTIPILARWLGFGGL